jgi:peptide/nickel transport system substrate-binding protein
MASNWSGNWGQYSNPEVDELIASIPTETDYDTLVDTYTRLVEIYLTDVPSFTLMYRPDVFHTVYEGVWTGFPYDGDGTMPPVPPMDCSDGWGVACLYNLELVGE